MENTPVKKGALARFLDFVEKSGNKLPDPAVLFLILMLTVWAVSFLISGVSFSEIDPRTGQAIQIKNLLTGPSMAAFLSDMVKTFMGFAPLGIVLVAMLGVGVAEQAGFINAGLKILLSVTPKMLLTPILILVAILSHTATDAGYVLVIPLGGVIFYAAGRHPLAGIAAAFAGVSGGFSANFVPSGIDVLLQGFTQSAARIIDPNIELNPLNNIFFTASSSFLIIGLGWYITDKFIEPRLNKNTPVDDVIDDVPKMDALSKKEKSAFLISVSLMILSLVGLYLWAAPADSSLRAPSGEIASFSAPLMRSIVPIIFLVFFLPGTLYGFLTKTFNNTKELIQSMSKAMSGMSYYIVMAFFCALFIDAFGQSNIGALLALKGAAGLKSLALPAEVTIAGIVLLTSFVNLLVGSASAKWALIGPIVVPMLMQLNISPDLTQAAYRVGDSTTNIITPLLPYFPLIVVFCQRYVKKTGIGTLVSMMLPYTIIFLISWTIFLLLYWKLGLPLGLQSTYEYFMVN